MYGRKFDLFVLNNGCTWFDLTTLAVGAMSILLIVVVTRGNDRE